MKSRFMQPKITNSGTTSRHRLMRCGVSLTGCCCASKSAQGLIYLFLHLFACSYTMPSDVRAAVNMHRSMACSGKTSYVRAGVHWQHHTALSRPTPPHGFPLTHGRSSYGVGGRCRPGAGPHDRPAARAAGWPRVYATLGPLPQGLPEVRVVVVGPLHAGLDIE